MELVLASTSPYRRVLLERLGVPFVTFKPDVDETPRPDEPAWALARRLAQAKAEAAQVLFPSSLIIGSDQVATLDGALIGKPGNHARATAQLRAVSGRCVDFYTGLCVLNTKTRQAHSEVVPYAILFRTLTERDIEHYLRREQPYDCAGSFKSEGLGTALFAKHLGDDPTALIGLPLIRLVALLQREGLDVLGDGSTTDTVR